MRKRISYRDAAHGRIEGSPGEERGETPAIEAAEIRAGTDGPIGASAVGPGDGPIPHAGSVTSKPGSKGGLQAGHPLNKVTPTSSTERQTGEHMMPQNAVTPGAAGAKPLPLAPDHRRHVAPPRGAAGSNRREVGHFLARLARQGAR